MPTNKRLIQFMVAIGLAFSLAACYRTAPERQAEVASVDAVAGKKLTAKMVEEAYVWGLPIVSMYRYMETMGTAVNAINQLHHNRNLTPPGMLVGNPNRDTLYSYGWFDLADGPIVVSLPDFDDRYFVWQLTDMYAHNFHNVGSHLREGPTEKYRSGYTFALVGPDWAGELPEGLDGVRAPVRMIHSLVRIAVQNLAEDIAAANRLQDKIATMPLADWVAGKRQTVQKLPTSPAPLYREVLAFGRGVTGADQRNPDFFSVLADAISINRPYAPWDIAMAEGTLAALGVSPGQSFDFNAFDSDTQGLILDAQKLAYDQVKDLGNGGYGPEINGWQYGPPNHGNWGDDFIRRAFATHTGGMWPTNNNSTYAKIFKDSDGKRLTGEQRYRFHFAAGELPPVTAFWSFTVYDPGTADLYPNAEGRYVVGSNHPETVFGEDGSLDILFSHQRPDNVEAVNWLPIPEGEFTLSARFYAPMADVLSLEYKLSPLKRI